MSTAIFVEELYTKLLGRESDPNGKAYWVSQIDSGVLSSTQTTACFLESAEFSDVVTPIASLYYTAFDRIPDVEGMLYWVKAFQGGMSMQDITSFFINSTEFQAKYGNSVDNSTFIGQLYQSAFNRAPDDEEGAYWLNVLDYGSTRADVLISFASSTEMNAAKGAEVKIVAAYHSILNTSPTQAQINASTSLGDDIFTVDSLYSIKSSSLGSTLTGKVVDGYIRDATVFSDANGDGVWNEGEAKTITDAKGNFSLTGAKGTLISIGGTDTSSGNAFKGIISAPENSTVINPLTTLQQAFVSTGFSVDEAEFKVGQALGIDISQIDLTTYDPLAAAFDPTNSAAEKAIAINIQSEAAKIINMLVASTSALVSAAGGNDNLTTVEATNAIMQSMANAIVNDSDGVVSFANSDFVESVFTGSVEAAGDADLTAVEAVITDMGNSFSILLSNNAKAINTAIDSGENLIQVLAKVSQISSLAQENMTENIVALASDGDLSDLVSIFSGAALDVLITEEEVIDLYPNSDVDTLGIEVINAQTAATGVSTSAPIASIDTIAPTVAITDNNAGTATGDVTYTFTLSEASTDFAASDITVVGGTAGAFTATSSTVYTLVVTPPTNSTTSMTVDVAANAFTDAAGNNNAAASQSVQQVDTTPAVIFTSSVAVDASGTITATLASALGTAGTFGLYTLADGATAYTETVTPSSLISISTAASLTKGVHANTQSSAFAIVKDHNGVIIGDVQSVIFGSTAADTPIPITGTANNDIIFGFAGADIINAGDGNDIIIAGDAGTKSVNGEGGDDTINGGAAIDNINGGDGVDIMTGLAGADIYDFAGTSDIDSSLGVVTDIITDFKVEGADTIKGAWGAAAGAFTKAGATVADLETLLVAANTALDGTTKYYVGQVDGGHTYMVSDSDGTGYTEVIQLTGVALATVLVGDIVASAPTVTLTSSVTAVKVGETATITATFSQAPTGFAIGDFVSAAGAFSAFTTVNTTTFTAIFTPTADSGTTDSAITITAGSYTNAAGNAGTAGAQPTLAMDMIVPTIAITDNNAGTATGDVTYTFTLSEASTDFAASDITVVGGTAGAFTATSSTVYTLVVTPPTNSTTSMTVDVAANAFTDAAGNNNAAASQSVQQVDTTPAVIFTSSVAVDASGTITATLASALGTAGTFGLYTLADGATAYTETVTPSSLISISTAASLTKGVHANTQSSAFAIVKDHNGVIIGDVQSVIFGSTAADTPIPITGTANNDIIFGFAGADIINAGDGNDIIIAGDAGTKSVNGEGGDDTINGGAAIDNINGGDGVDIMTGLAGADIYDFAGTSDIDSSLGVVTDIITDFKVEGADTIKGAWGAAAGAFTKAGATVADLETLLVAANTALDGTTKYYVGQVDGGHTYMVSDSDGTGYTEVIQLTGVALATVLVGDIVA